MTRLEGVEIADIQGEDRKYSPQHIISIFDGGVGGNRDPARTTMTASYRTPTSSPTVYYTALNTDGTVLTSRRTGGVSLSPAGDYTFSQDVSNLASPREFIAVWDEGDPSVYTLERIVVDT